MRDKLNWLAEQLEESIHALRPATALDSIMLQGNRYFVYLSGVSPAHVEFDQDLINDMTDSGKPAPETKAKFRAAVAQEFRWVRRDFALASTR